MRLEGKVAFISGSTRGIGRTTAELFAAEGAKVVVTGRSVDKGENTAARIRDAGGDATFVTLDVSDEGSVRAAIDATVERYGKLTTLVNNAAATDLVNAGMKPLTEHSTEEWDAIIRTTLTGNVFWACKYGIPHLVAAGGGSIINVSSGGAVFGSPGISAYSAAKGGMNAVTRTIAVEYAARQHPLQRDRRRPRGVAPEGPRPQRTRRAHPRRSTERHRLRRHVARGRRVGIHHGLHNHRRRRDVDQPRPRLTPFGAQEIRC